MSAAVIGLDLSITATGIADTDGMTSTVGGKAQLGDRRLDIISRAVLDEIMRCPDLVVIEDLASGHSKGVGLAAAQVMGAVKLRLIDFHTPYALVPPAVLKKYATGKGNADKTAMALALYKRTGLALADSDQVDAWWLRAMGLDHLGEPPVELPAVQRDALDRVQWPEVEG